MAGSCSTFGSAGRAILWTLLNFPRLEKEMDVSAALRTTILGKTAGADAMHRGVANRHRPLLPLPLDEASLIGAEAQSMQFEDFVHAPSSRQRDEDTWVALSILAINAGAGYGRAFLAKKASKAQVLALAAVRNSVRRVLPEDLRLERSLPEAEKELASRFVTYTGEEVPKMQKLTIAQALPALPPQTHGGSIDARALVCEGTRWFLEHPEESLLDQPTPGVKLQAKVHVDPLEALDLFKLLVSRNICCWVPDCDVLVRNGQQVLSGMFAVGKGTFLPTGEEVQRIIMNLIPSNACFRHSQGGTAELPSITQYLSLVLQADQKVAYFQSDMTSAFYLFRIPSAWNSMMAFNIAFKGSDINMSPDVWYRPSCAVIPMGWSSAVSVMQELAEKLTCIARLPASHRVRRSAPVPAWLTETCVEAERQHRAWYHVYLDNFCAMEKVSEQEEPLEGRDIHDRLETAWEKVGVLSSAKKRISGEFEALELGAHLQGKQGTIGPSGERLLRLIQSTLLVISKPCLRKKWVQVLAGRWVHCMSFRRPCMSFFDTTWAYVSDQATGVLVESKVRSELLNCCCSCLLMHTNLRAGVTGLTTASDASMTGGAVGSSDMLSVSGQEFAAADREGRAEGREAPILVLSLFNGVGCAFRCYDLIGIRPQVGISYELSAEGNRITSRRWPFVKICGDVRSLTIDVVREWRYLHPSIQQIHIWGGFPCSDLCSAKYGRLNLEGDQSSLFWEFVRIVKLVRQVFGFSFDVKFAAENVASMDASAEEEITRTLGVRPWRFDPADCVPIHRPRFCWTSAELYPIEGVWVEEKQRWLEIRTEHEYPTLGQWLEEGCIWPGYERGTILPTCMKSIKRARPPPSPAGLNRVDYEGKLRWEADQYRFPPYQYSSQFVIWKGDKWRLISADERELLHGLGYEHTVLCWNASAIKKDPKGFEDCPSYWPGQSSRLDRQRARRNIVLEDVGITSMTLDRYYTAVSRMAPILEAVNSEPALDEAIADWIQDEFEDGTPLHLIGDALSGLHHFEPATRRKLPKSWRLYSIWRRYEVPCRAPPITQDIVLGMAGWCILHDELTMGALLLLGFHALLRTGELLQVRPCDFLLQPGKGLVSLPSSKSGVRNNTRESVALSDPCTLETLQAMIDLKDQQNLSQVPCWNYSGSRFRILFRKVLDQLDLSELGFRPYSLRRGGATWEMQSHGLMEKTLIRGRWRNSSIARIYISDGLSLLPALRMSLRAKHQVAKFSSMFINEHQAFSGGKRGKKRPHG
eukprot:s2345_g4.t1